MFMIVLSKFIVKESRGRNGNGQQISLEVTILLLLFKSLVQSSFLLLNGATETTISLTLVFCCHTNINHLYLNNHYSEPWKGYTT
jgi:hypothetical protein